MARGSFAVQVDRDVCAGQRPVEGRERPGRMKLVHGAAQAGERLEWSGRREYESVVGMCVAQRSQSWQAGQEVAEAEGAEDEEQRSRGYGHDDSTEGATTSSRTSQPAGWESAKRTVAATSSGRLRRASGGGL